MLSPVMQIERSMNEQIQELIINQIYAGNLNIQINNLSVALPSGEIFQAPAQLT